MLKQQLKEIALRFFTVPEPYKLAIEDVTDENATFYWKDVNSVEGYYIELDLDGHLLSLSQPLVQSNERFSIKEQQQLAEQFLTTQYAEALDYYTLSKVTEHEDRSRFNFEQFVDGYPLARFYCIIEIAANGQVLDFNYKGYTENPPRFPEKLVSKETILNKLFEADWTPSVSYLTSESYSVPASGLYALYESPIVYQTYNADIESCTFDEEVNADLDVEEETYVPLPAVEPQTPEQSIEAIIGVTSSMEIVRQAMTGEDTQVIVWREKDWQTPNDKSMDSYWQEHIEQSVKAEIRNSTNQLKGFVWFKERTGDLDLSYEACRNIAISFITTYYREYVPYLQMKLDEPSFNELHRACFIFSLTVDGYQVDIFMITVNKTTGFIDMLMTPKIDISVIKAYTPAPLLKLSEAKHALKDVDAVLKWAHRYNGEDAAEQLEYAFGHSKTKQSIRGINAVTGELILRKF